MSFKLAQCADKDRLGVIGFEVLAKVITGVELLRRLSGGEGRSDRVIRSRNTESADTSFNVCGSAKCQDIVIVWCDMA